MDPVPQAAYPSKARRPSNSALSTAKLAGTGLALRPWQEAVAEYVSEVAGSAGELQRPAGREL